MSASAPRCLLLFACLLASLAPARATGAETKKGQPGVVLVDTKFWVQGQSVEDAPTGTFARGTRVEVTSEFRDGDVVYKFVRLVEPGKETAKAGWVRANEVAIEAESGAHFLPAVPGRINEIGFESLRRAGGSERQNALVSPYGIWANLAVLQQGALGNSAREIEKLIGAPEEGLPSSFRSTEFRSIDALIKRPDLELTDTFRGFAAVRGLDVKESTFDEPGRQAFNGWVKEQSNSMISEFFPAGSWDDKETQALIANVAYFKGDWLIPFEKELTRPDEFQVTAGQTIPVNMMMSLSQYAWFQDEASNLDGVVLPYKEGPIAAVVIVPRSVDGLPGLVGNLNQALVEKLFAEMPRDLKALRTTDVSLSLPKIDLADEFPVSEALNLRYLTSNEADLSGMFQTGKVKISRILQKTRLKVDEKGTEAAAATVAVAVPSAINQAQPKVIVADHPFLFCIMHWPSRSILFAAAVFNPVPEPQASK